VQQSASDIMNRKLDNNNNIIIFLIIMAFIKEGTQKYITILHKALYNNNNKKCRTYFKR